MASSGHSLPVLPPASPAPTRNSLWVPASCSLRGYDDYDDNSWWWGCNTFCPFPIDNPQTSGSTNRSRVQGKSVVTVSSQESLGLECSDGYVNPDGLNWNSTSDYYESLTGIELGSNTYSHDFPLSFKSLCQPEFMSTLPMSDRGGSSTELEFAIQSSFSNNLPTMTAK